MAWLEEEAPSRDQRAVSHRGGAAGNVDPRLAVAVKRLRGRDPVLAALIDRHGPCTLMPTSSYFPVLVETIISQQLSTRAARAIYRRLIDLVGRRSPRPADVAGIPDRSLLGIGFSRSKTRYVKNAAEAFRSRRMGPKTFQRMSDSEAVEFLTSIKGIGEWSAHMFLIFALGRLDVFPVGDLGLRNAMAAAYGLRTPPSPERLLEIGDRWRPYRTIGTWYLWESYDNG